MASALTSIVLVPGAWHGGWCWRNVLPLLRAPGHAVFAPTLTGLGERAHLLTPRVGLDTHVLDLANLLDYEELGDVVLVGHSYGALVAAQLAEQMPERIRHLVAVDATLPADGQTGFDVLGPDRAAALTERAQRSGDGWRIPPGDPAGLGITDPADLAWVARRLTPHPLRSYRQPLRLGGAAAASIPRTLIACAPGRTAPPGVHLVRLATGHDAMITAPDLLAAELLRIASR